MHTKLFKTFLIIALTLSIILLSLLILTSVKEEPAQVDTSKEKEMLTTQENDQPAEKDIEQKFSFKEEDIVTIPMNDLEPESKNTTPPGNQNSSIESREPIATPPLNYHSPTVMAWIYPGEPACNATQEFSDGRHIDILKPEFFTINGGSLTLLRQAEVGCNGYSPDFVNKIKRYSNQQFITVSSADANDMKSFLATALNDGKAITDLVDFVSKYNLTGIELNFEDFGNWDTQSYADFKKFVTELGNALHNQNKKLMIVGPPVSNRTEENWYLWRYEDFVNLPADHMVVMGYDYQFDHGSGNPVAPLDWLSEVISWISNRYPKDKLTIGIPSYGYEGRRGRHDISILTFEQIANKPGFDKANRDERSAEMTWRQSGIFYVYQDSISMQEKINLVKSHGINSVSIWHLGGNPWFK